MIFDAHSPMHKQYSTLFLKTDSFSSMSADEKGNSTGTFTYFFLSVNLSVFAAFQTIVCNWYVEEPNFVWRVPVISLFPGTGFFMVKCKTWIGAGVE